MLKAIMRPARSAILARMSALGRKRTFAVQKAMYPLCPESDRKSGHAANGHVCFTPKSRHVRCN
jgi:hypothetical protein